MRIFPYQDGDRFIELVEKREYDILAQERADFGVLVDKLERELNAAVRRMNDVSAGVIEDAYWSSWEPHQNIRNLFIQAAKGSQP